MIEISENTLALWYVTLKNGDWLAVVESVDDGYKLTYRFRYYIDDKVWDSDDRKSWYRVTTLDLEKLLNVTRKLAHVVKERDGGEMWELQRGTGTVDSFMKQFRALPFAHSKELDY